jgi:hypothetical protein
LEGGNFRLGRDACDGRGSGGQAGLRRRHAVRLGLFRSGLFGRQSRVDAGTTLGLTSSTTTSGPGFFVPLVAIVVTGVQGLLARGTDAYFLRTVSILLLGGCRSFLCGRDTFGRLGGFNTRLAFERASRFAMLLQGLYVVLRPERERRAWEMTMNDDGDDE